MPGKIRVINAALDQVRDRKVLRGRLDMSTLRNIQVPDYQREVGSDYKIGKLMDAYRAGDHVPDVELGMRGHRITDSGGGVFDLLDDTFMIDGLQRISAGLRVMDVDEEVTPYIGALINFDTDEPWERKRFEILNVERSRLSPNVLLRNLKEEIPAMRSLYRLTADQSFPLRSKVQWKQKAKKTELITATVYVKTAARLHTHITPARGSDVRVIATAVDRIMDVVGKNIFLANIREFYTLLDDCFGIRDEEMRGATHLTQNFLLVLASVFSEHENFWTGDRLAVPARLQSKLAKFPIRDSNVKDLARSSGPAAGMLYRMLVDHLDSGVRTNRLQKWESEDRRVEQLFANEAE